MVLKSHSTYHNHMIKILDTFRSNRQLVQSFIDRSYLHDEMKKAYLNSYLNKLKALNDSMAARI